MVQVFLLFSDTILPLLQHLQIFRPSVFPLS
jgi:hypothetical protein